MAEDLAAEIDKETKGQVVLDLLQTSLKIVFHFSKQQQEATLVSLPISPS